MFTIVPRAATNHRVEILVVAFFRTSRPAVLELEVEHLRKPIPVDSWQVIDGGTSDAIYYWIHRIDGLHANRSHRVALMWGREQLARARFETLPERLPDGDLGAGPTRPFTLWLSSCFAARQAQPGLGDVVERVFSSPQLRPHMNCHVGDQVYLDELWLFIYTALTQRRLRSRFNDQYASTFTHPDFSRLLSSASNRFLADDHELWNNYPHDPFDLPLRSKRFWHRWLELAWFERCVPLQAPERLEFLTIGEDLSICLADFRFARSEHGARLCDREDMERIVDWLGKLRTPGVLITQQPIISKRGTGGDRKLPDYGQYWLDLLPAIHACKQDLVVLAGDVHHGFVGQTAIGPNADGQLIQVVASPLALVNPIASSSALPALRFFPGADAKDVARPIEYPLLVPTFDAGRHTRRTEDHAMTISFWKRAEERGRAQQTRRLGMRVRTWLTRAASQALAPSWETTLTIR